MVKKWKIGELYAFNNDASPTSLFYSIDWSESKYIRYNKPFVLLEKPCSRPKTIYGLTQFYGKVLLTTTGEIYWVMLERWQCSVVDKKWLRNNSHV